MAITVTRYQRRPPEVDVVVFSKAADAAEIAAWIKGTVQADGSILIPDPTGGQWVARVGSAVVRHPNGGVEVSTPAEVDAAYTTKLV